MRGATADDEKPKGPEKSVIGKALSGVAHKKGEGAGDGDVRQANEEIRKDVRPDEARVADVAVPVWKEIGSEETTGENPEKRRSDKERK
jgi:hypothetical protein